VLTRTLAQALQSVWPQRWRWALGLSAAVLSATVLALALARWPRAAHTPARALLVERAQEALQLAPAPSAPTLATGASAHARAEELSSPAAPAAPVPRATDSARKLREPARRTAAAPAGRASAPARPEANRAGPTPPLLGANRSPIIE
jgi:hypothetical protein